MKKKNKIKISLKMIIALFILLIIALPIYPCYVSRVESSFIPNVNQHTYVNYYSNYSDVHPLLTVLAGFFNWKEFRGSCLMDHSTTVHHQANPLFLLLYLGIIALFIFILKMFNKNLFQKKEVEVDKRKMNTLFLILGCTFILIACYFSIISLKLAIGGQPVNIASLSILCLIIGPIYLAVGLRLLFIKYKIGYEAYIGGIILAFYLITLALFLCLM